MALDIGIGNGTSLSPVKGEPSISLDNDGYYWFLHPLFEDLRTTTGQYIDLYGDASFSGEQLVALEEMLKNARRLVDLQSAIWSVCIGYELVPRRKNARSRSRPKEIMATVEKQRFLAELDKWESIVARAKELNRPVVCFGD